MMNNSNKVYILTVSTLQRKPGEVYGKWIVTKTLAFTTFEALREYASNLDGHIQAATNVDVMDEADWLKWADDE